MGEMPLVDYPLLVLNAFIDCQIPTQLTQGSHIFWQELQGTKFTKPFLILGFPTFNIN